MVAGMALGLFAAPALADDGKCLLGVWEGILMEKKADGRTGFIAVLMKMSSLEKDFKKPEEDQDVLHFAPARSCKVDLSYVVFYDNAHYLTMTNANGGLCERLQGEQMRVECVSPDKLKVTYQYQTGAKTLKAENNFWFHTVEKFCCSRRFRNRLHDCLRGSLNIWQAVIKAHPSHNNLNRAWSKIMIVFGILNKWFVLFLNGTWLPGEAARR
jgi:hypothetical protein